MLSLIAIFCLIGAVTLLTTLAWIDLKTWLLPNEMVLGFASLGFVFHLTTIAEYVSVRDIFLGAIVGFSALFLIRAAANAYYKTDTLGLGDVKLMTAAGVWLGPQGLLLALVAGSAAGVMHGVGYAFYRHRKYEEPLSFARLRMPAGPGFAAGILIAGIYTFRYFKPF